jgi:hypothetical protein
MGATIGGLKLIEQNVNYRILNNEHCSCALSNFRREIMVLNLKNKLALEHNYRQMMNDNKWLLKIRNNQLSVFS